MSRVEFDFVSDGLLALMDEGTRLGDNVNNFVVSSFQHYIYLAVRSADYGAARIVLDEGSRSTRDESLALRWEGSIVCTSGFLVLADVTVEGEMELWRRPFAGKVPLAIYADRERNPTYLSVVVGSAPAPQTSHPAADASHAVDDHDDSDPDVGGVGRPIVIDEVRPFAWGVLHVMESESIDVPIHENGEQFVTTQSGISMLVPHADDIANGQAEGPTLVRLVVRVGVTANPVDFDGSIEVPPGLVTIGDGEREVGVDVVPGTVSVKIVTRPLGNPGQVNIWLS